MIVITVMRKGAEELDLKPLPRRLKVAGKMFLVLTPLVLMWSISLRLVAAAITSMGSAWGSARPLDFGAMTTVLFGASSVALVIFSAFLAVLAFFGWEALKNHVRREIESDTKERITKLEKSLQGRAYAVIGMIIGTQHCDPEKLTASDEKDLEYLSEAIHHCEHGYSLLNSAESPGRHMALNNLIYFKCQVGKDLEAKRLLKDADSLKEIGENQEMSVGAPYLLTYCRVVLQVGSDSTAWKEAIVIAEEILGHPKVTALQKREAAFYATSLKQKLGSGPK